MSTKFILTCTPYHFHFTRLIQNLIPVIGNLLCNEMTKRNIKKGNLQIFTQSIFTYSQAFFLAFYSSRWLIQIIFIDYKKLPNNRQNMNQYTPKHLAEGSLHDSEVLRYFKNVHFRSFKRLPRPWFLPSILCFFWVHFICLSNNCNYLIFCNAALTMQTIIFSLTSLSISMRIWKDQDQIIFSLFFEKIPIFHHG